MRWLNSELEFASEAGTGAAPDVLAEPDKSVKGKRDSDQDVFWGRRLRGHLVRLVKWSERPDTRFAVKVACTVAAMAIPGNMGAQWYMNIRGNWAVVTVRICGWCTNYLRQPNALRCQ